MKIFRLGGNIILQDEKEFLSTSLETDSSQQKIEDIFEKSKPINREDIIKLEKELRKVPNIRDEALNILKNAQKETQEKVESKETIR